MNINTLKDIIHWTRSAHTHLSDHMSRSAAETGSERAQMLLNYLADHERLLSDKLDSFEHNGDLSALNTWCYEFIDQKPMLSGTGEDAPFADMNSETIAATLAEQHQTIIGLYKHLLDQADSNSLRESLQQLVDMEEHEVMVMMQSANRLSDL